MNLDDRKAAVVKIGAGAGQTSQCLLRTISFLAMFFLPSSLMAAGAVTTVRFDSPALGVSKNYVVYLPEDYASSRARYPVIYLLHGWGATERSWTSPALDVATTADALRLQALIVMPDGDRSFYLNSVTPANFTQCMAENPPRRNRSEPRDEFCVRRANYETYIVEDLVADVDSRFRTVAQRGGRALMGESAGGLGALALAMRHPNRFSATAAHSAFPALLYDGSKGIRRGPKSFRRNFDSYPEGLQEPVSILGKDIANWRAHDPYHLAAKLQPGRLAIYIDCGLDDEAFALEPTLLFHDRLLELKIPHAFFIMPGRHDEAFWKERSRHSLAFLRRHFQGGR